MSSKTNNREKGSVIVFSIFIIAAMVSSTVIIAGIFAPKIRSVYESVNSTVALYGADSASEVCLYETRRQTGPVPRLLPAGLTIKIASLSATEVDVTNDCRPMGKNFFTFRATGTFRGLSRSLEVQQ
ncbi:MAG: hypothetical protein Q8P35_01430 [Candidatus Yanofskybacteria bacterium]|nr:hypothetical protein [Candidatus Yanofskybacteria bacterium]